MSEFETNSQGIFGLDATIVLQHARLIRSRDLDKAGIMSRLRANYPHLHGALDDRIQAAEEAFPPAMAEIIRQATAAGSGIALGTAERLSGYTGIPLPASPDFPPVREWELRSIEKMKRIVEANPQLTDNGNLEVTTSVASCINHFKAELPVFFDAAATNLTRILGRPNSYVQNVATDAARRARNIDALSKGAALDAAHAEYMIAFYESYGCVMLDLRSYYDTEQLPDLEQA